MKKALTLLAVAAMAAVSFVGCSKTYDVDATLETGTANYDFNGKTFVRTEGTDAKIMKSVYDSATKQTTQSLIDTATETTTIVFGVDGTFTSTYEKNFIAAKDGDYRKFVEGTITTQYFDQNDGLANSDAKISGLANKPDFKSVTTGTWKAYTRQDSATDGTTLEYEILPSTEVQTSYKYNNTPTYTLVAAYVGGSTELDSYTAGGSWTQTTAQNAYNMSYLYEGQTADGKDIVKINGDTYIQQ